MKMVDEVDVHLYRSMIGSLMYLTSLRPDIMFAVCACVRYQVNPKVSHLHAVKMIFRYLKGQLKLGLWYPKDFLFDLIAYTDSDYTRASLDMKSTTGGCQFLGSRLISWQCKKQTVVANSTTEAEYVAASSCFNAARHNLLLLLKVNVARHNLLLLLKVNAARHKLTTAVETLVDGKKIIVTEASVRRDLQLNDEEGMDCLPNATIFEELTRMGKPKRKDTEVPQPSGPTYNVTDKAIYEEMDAVWKGLPLLGRIIGIKSLQEVLEVTAAKICATAAKLNTASTIVGIVSTTWSKVSTDGLHSSNGNVVIFVVTDRLSKYVYFIPLSYPFTDAQVAWVFLDNVYKLHGLPKIIMSDRDKIDGQTRVVNRCFECYLRCISGEKPRPDQNGSVWLSTGQCLVDAVDRTLAAREAMIQLLQFHLDKAQQRIKAIAD
ncbi:uncharacterized mitochondrial protein-like protein [Tanacetum coccineum]